jgi:hypothetical protein
MARVDFLSELEQSKGFDLIFSLGTSSVLPVNENVILVAAPATPSCWAVKE